MNKLKIHLLGNSIKQETVGLKAMLDSRWILQGTAKISETTGLIPLGEIVNEDLSLESFIIRISNILDSIEEHNHILAGKN